MPSTEVDLAQLFQPEGMLKVTVLPFQQQKAATDCGLFSIVAAYHFAWGDDLSKLSFCQESMRAHLIRCLESQELSAFPHASTLVTRNRKKTAFIHI